MVRSIVNVESFQLEYFNGNNNRKKNVVQQFSKLQLELLNNCYIS